MKFKSFHWLSHHGIRAIIPCSTSMVSVSLILGGVFTFILLLFYFSFLYFGCVYNKTIIPLELVGYEMITV